MMKKQLLHAMCLTASTLVLGGVNSAFANSLSTQGFAIADDDEGNTSGSRTDVTAGDETNKATFSWSGQTLTVTGQGDLSKITVIDENTKVFSATGAGKVYTKATTTGSDGAETTTATPVKQGDKYDAETKYYEAEFTYDEKFDGKSVPTTQQDVYTVANKYVSLVEEGKAIYPYYFSTRSELDADQSYKTITTIVITKSEVTFSDDGGVYSGGSWVSDWDGTYTQGEKTLYKYLVADKTLETTTLDYDKVGESNIVILTPSNRSTYVSTVTTITPSVTNLFSKASNSDSYTARTSAWTWSEGEAIYTGTATVKEDAIADNATYFGTTHSDYLESAVLSFADYLPIAVANLELSEDQTATVIFKTAEKQENKAEISNAIIRSLVSVNAIETLNLYGVKLAKLNTYKPSEYNSGYNDPTFFVGEPTGSYQPATNSTLKNLYMPETDTKEIAEVMDNGNNTYRLFQYMTGLKHITLSEGITTLGESAISNNGQNNVPLLTSITFPNTLTTAKKECLNGQTGIQTLTFPKGMQTIETHAFWGTNTKDVYFLGTTAPKVAAFAWGESTYISNNSMTNEVTVGDTDGTSIKVNKSTGVAVRQNYNSQNGWYGMLHYPAACTKAEAARYTDLTRDYKKIVYGVENDIFKQAKNSTDDGTDGTLYYYYEAGKETTTLKGKPLATGDADITSNLTAATIFTNRYPTSSNDPYGGDYSGGYEDYYVGSQFIWPSIAQAQRAIIVAENGVLWDGVTTIGAGIKNNLGEGETYEEDGSEYIGLHQFVFAQADVTNDKTDEWDMTKYADGKWHSICLPFNVTKAKMKETFGPTAEGEYNIRVCKFHKVDRTDKKLKLYFNDEYFEKAQDDDVVLAAHVSYMIRAKKENVVDGETVVLKDYEMVEGSPVPTNVTVNAKSNGGSEGETEEGQYYFIGQYNSGVTIPQYSYFFSKTKGYFRFQAGTTAKWNGYTSVVEAPNGANDYKKYFNGTTDSDAKLSTIWDEDGDNETTDIDRVTIIAGDEIISTNDNVYNLNGQLVSTNGRTGLPKGIYVQGGKKYIVK